MGEYSPGPWKIRVNDFDSEMREINLAELFGFVKIESPGGDLVSGDVDTSTPEGKANAKLIAAAPALLTALQSCVPHLEALERMYDYELPEVEEARAAINAALAEYV